MKDQRAVHAVTFSRYRAFEHKQQLELKPLTLLFGLNSVGKSAALRLLPILAASALHKQRKAAVLDYASPALREAVFQDLIYNGQVAAGLQFGFDWGDVQYDVTLRDLGADGEVIGEFEAKVDGQAFSGGLADEGRGAFEVISNGQASQWKLAGLRPVEADTEEGKRFAGILCERLAAFASSVHWLGAVRAAVPRMFELRTSADGRINPDGSGVAEAIRISAAAGDGAADAVSKWLEKACQSTLSFAQSDEAIAFNRRFFPFNVITAAGRHIAVRDVGEGIAQALPVVMLCHQALLGQLGDNAILAFEQPELHLHPAASVHLADEIIDCIAKGSNARHVIETHAESMLLSVQIGIVEKRVRPQDVIVYWVSADENGTSLRPITFDEEGFAVGGWPQGVFRETLDQARRLAQLRIDPS
ncbi:AAA family ATPase [Mesorhizobium sp. M0494]|uniref:AAA family ATPase n=1 Tax=Mesorhizobium sp. M0494 TaxID=2956951 RepID=UPI003337C0BC